MAREIDEIAIRDISALRSTLVFTTGNAILKKDVWVVSSSVARITAKDAAKLARAFAKDRVRLITDPEWEYVAREGGKEVWVIDVQSRAWVERGRLRHDALARTLAAIATKDFPRGPADVR